VNPKINVSCGKELVCGWEGVCENCTEGNMKKWDDEGELCSGASQSKEEWVKNKTAHEMKKVWNNIPRRTFANWSKVYAKVTKAWRGNRCKTNTLEEAKSGYVLMDLLKGGNLQKSVMVEAWPKIDNYTKELEVILKEGVAQRVILCEGDGLICVDRQCKTCDELWLIGELGAEEGLTREERVARIRKRYWSFGSDRDVEEHILQEEGKVGMRKKLKGAKEMYEWCSKLPKPTWRPDNEQVPNAA